MSRTQKLDDLIVSRFQQTGWDTLYLYFRKRKRRQMRLFQDRYLGASLSDAERRWHTRRMRWAYIRYGWWFDEYFMFNFNKLSHRGKMAFVPNTQKDYFCDKVNSPEVHDLFTDKWLAYQKFSKYYCREVCQFGANGVLDSTAENFIKRHRSFIVKPLDDSFGGGCRVVSGASVSEVETMLKDYSSGGVLEELIVQNEAMASLHPQSVNTVRISTLKIDGQVHVIHPFFRVGRGEDVVDNAAKGGIFGVIDIDSGIVTTACDELGNRYVLHPDTQKPVVGFAIPRWGDALALARELAEVVPESVFTGWDLAYTDEGWVMVEGNSRGQFVCFQMATQQGFRNELEGLLGRSLKEFCHR